MSSKNPLPEARFAAIAAGIVVLILYGSLYPFDFHHRAILAGPFRALLSTSAISYDRGDLISNVLLYFPLGLFGALSLRRFSPLAGILMVACAGLALSLGIESAQFYDDGRVPSMADVYANGGGAFLGALAGAFFRRDLPLLRNFEWRPFAILLLASWLGNRLIPYVPSLSPSKYAHALRNLFSLHAMQPVEIYKYFVLWLAAAVLLEALTGVARSKRTVILLLGLVMIGRTLIIDIAPSPAEMAGGLCAAALWIPLSRFPARGRFVTILLVIFIAIQALQPFHFSSTARPFGWIPFVSFMVDAREHASSVFLEKTFTYGSLIWLLNRSGVAPILATWLSATFVFSLRFAQIYLPGRSAEISDTLMVLILGGVMSLMIDQVQETNGA